jgi:hypothetical protein
MSAFLNEYNVTPTVSGQSIGSIDVVNVSGGTGPYTVSWSGATVNGVTTGTTWDQNNLAEGVYKATITDTNSNEGTTLVYLSAYTNPTFSALITSYSCVTNPNLYCEVTVYSAGTNNVFSPLSGQQSASTFNYSLYKDGALFESKTVATADTQTSQVFKNLTNGEYMLNVGREQSLTRNFKITDSQCTAGTISVSATSNPAYRLSAITSAYTINSHFAAATMYIGNTPGFHTTGLNNWTHVLNTPGHWFFTGNTTSGGALDYPNVNPNTARTTDTDRYWYLGVSGSSDCQEGWNCGPSGVSNGDPVVANSQKDLTGATINTTAFRGTYYYHKYLNKFFIWDSTTGVTNSDMAWVTFNPTADRDSKGDPVSSEIITQKDTTFQFLALTAAGATNIFPYVGNSNVVGDYRGYASKLQNNYCSTAIKHLFTSGDTSRTSLISPCSYLDYTHETYLFQSGGSDSSASVVLAYFRDNNGTYGESGATHYLTLDYQQSSGATVSFNKGQSARAFQRDAYGQEIIVGNPEDSEDPEVVEAIRRAKEQAIAQFQEEYPDLAIGGMAPMEDDVGGDDEHGSDYGTDELFDIYSEIGEFVELYERILLTLLEGLDLNEYISTEYKEFSTIVLRNGPGGGVTPSGAHRSPYDLEFELPTQGAIKVKVTRSGNEGERFKIQMTPTMGEKSNAYAANATLDISASSATFKTYHEINFDLTDSNTWSGSSQSAPTWVTGTELQRFLGGTRVGHMVQGVFGVFYGGGLTGTGANYTVKPTTPTFISNNSAITLTEKTIYNPNISIGSQNLGSVVGNNNVQFSKNCDFNPRCGSELTIPNIRPKASATLQTFKEPKVILEGLSKPNGALEDLRIINLSGYSGNTPVITANTSGTTSDLLLEKSYLKINVHAYDYETSKLRIKPNYSYLFNTLSEISNPEDRKLGISLSAQTLIPLSGLPTASTWQYIIKPSFIFKDKSTKDPIWLDNYNYLGGVGINNTKDYYMALVEPPSEPNLKNQYINYDSKKSTGNLRIVSTVKTVTDVPDFLGTKSAFTWSALTIPYPPQSNVQVVVNGITVTQSLSKDINAYTSSSKYGPTGDYWWQGNRLIFRPATVKNNDIVQVLYPAVTDKNYYNQRLTVGTVGTDSNANIYQDTSNYYINLEYPSLGAIQLILNGQVLTEGVDFQKVGEKRIQFLTYVVDGTIDFSSSDIISMYYLTQYNLTGLASTRNPIVDISINKKLYVVEELKLVVIDSNGDIVQEDVETFNSSEGGVVSSRFIIDTPTFGTYSYTVQSKRYYPLLNNKEISTERSTKPISFIIDRTTFYSPYTKIPKNSGVGFGSYD